MPAKMRVSGSFRVECQHTLYRFFRYIAGPIEVAAVLISADVHPSLNITNAAEQQP
jgi:hypothetical protein